MAPTAFYAHNRHYRLRQPSIFTNDRKVKLFSYVIMENYLHLIAQSHELEKNMRAFKSFTARESINYLKSDGLST